MIDEHSAIEYVCELADGSRTTSEIVEILRERYPEARESERRASVLRAFSTGRIVLGNGWEVHAVR